MREIPNHYPDWVKEYFNAKMEDVPGFFGDWWDAAVRVEETDNSLTIYYMTDMDEDGRTENTKVATFYGTIHQRRVAAVKFLTDAIVSQVAMNAIAGKEIDDVYRWMCELPLRLTFSESYGNEVFGGPWK